MSTRSAPTGLRPISSDEAYALACRKLADGQLDVAESLLLALARQMPLHGSVLGMLGALRLQQGRLPEAIDHCEAARSADPASALHPTNLATALAGTGQPDAAINLLREVCAAHPGFVLAHYNLGNFLRDADEPSAAEAAYRAALAIDPAHVSCLTNLGTVLLGLGRYDEAEALFREALERDPRNASAAGNLALSAATRGDHAKAADTYASVLPIADAATADGVRFNRSLSLIRLGRYEEAFPLYESRWQGSRDLHHAYRYSSAQQWRGEPLAGKRLLVWGEQGFGDTLQFARYLPLVAARGPASLTLAVHPALVRLFRQSFPGVDVIAETGLPAQSGDAWDWHCPIMSVALALAHPGPVRKAGISDEIPYLHADSADIAQWEGRLASLEPTRPLRIGLSWRAGPKDKGERGFDLDLARPLAGLPNLRFYRLTRAETYRGAEPTPDGVDLVDPTADLTDFAATAALIGCLDYVISVDTSVLHLAGALGKQALGLLPAHGGNWFEPGEGQQPWYPTVTVWRQAAIGDWPSLLERVAEALRTGKLPGQQAPAHG
ncbi:tetratricopeptide repeat protein [Paraburkholderia sp. RP-4-7]|uniref:Tetratricopeptide repeat protein n=1 Tax=Paraburkholderia polaris TaxID=2728848 RepID=A0A848ICQ5_9BURK|nr:tetratricopeptide repeat protein [Paraburkholderia polaris]NML97864.1 tetratricopeptide repeat protein [Paraburkholderia polaris]